MKKCKVCRKKPRLERRVNSEGIVFCSDDCYEEFEQSDNDYSHPYIDDYEAVRYEYIEWMKSYEDELYRFYLTRNPSRSDLLEGIESVLTEFDDYYRLEGTDGVFSNEIYHYLLSLEELYELIENAPRRKGVKEKEEILKGGMVNEIILRERQFKVRWFGFRRRTSWIWCWLLGGWEHHLV